MMPVCELNVIRWTVALSRGICHNGYADCEEAGEAGRPSARSSMGPREAARGFLHDLHDPARQNRARFADSCIAGGAVLPNLICKGTGIHSPAGMPLAASAVSWRSMVSGCFFVIDRRLRKWYNQYKYVYHLVDSRL